jgi:hypothetical protein
LKLEKLEHFDPTGNPIARIQSQHTIGKLNNRYTRTEQREKEPGCALLAHWRREKTSRESKGAKPVGRFGDEENKSRAQGARGITNSFGATEIE